jgi:hypothetical protein
MTKRVCVLGVLLCIVTLGACRQADNLANVALPSGVSEDGSSTGDSAVAAGISDGRKNAARLIVPGSTFLVDLLQFDGGAGQHACYPLGDAVLGFAKWPSRLHNLPGFPIVVTSNFLQSEYDVLSTKGDTQYVLSVRTGTASQFSGQFSQVEFNFRAVNPFETNHVAHGGGHYLIHEADYPSNDAVLANRSLIDLAGGPIAILIQGLDFNIAAPVADTTAWMNALGAQGWVAFMRDNAYQSGRFYAILGALTGGPVALRDTPTPLDDGMFRSVQVRGDTFDANSENPGHLTTGTGTNECDVCPDFTPPPGFPVQPYALFDYGNFDEAGVATPGRGGFVFVMRPPAFPPAGGPVVVDPSAHPGQPPFAFPGNVIAAPGSGYAEAALNAAGLINHPAAVDNLPVGPQGVHELSISVFFIHTQGE